MINNIMTDIWRKDYNKFYKDHAYQKKFVYKFGWCLKLV